MNNAAPPATMKFTYSIPIDKDIEDDFRRRFGTKLPFRRVLNEDEAKRGSRRVIADWREYINPSLPLDFEACQTKHGHLMSLYFPECIPERIEILAYMSEYAFLHDGMSLFVLCEGVNNMVIGSRCCG
jgi:hypothetical protein